MLFPNPRVLDARSQCLVFLQFRQMFRFPAKRTFGATLSKRLKHTFENQETIQRLPIPSIENLKTKYLNSLKPLLGEGELLKTTEIVEEFLGNGICECLL